MAKTDRFVSLVGLVSQTNLSPIMSTMCDTNNNTSRGTFLNIFAGMDTATNTMDITSEVIRDTLAARSNTMLYNTFGITMSGAGQAKATQAQATQAMEVAYKLYDDWDSHDSDIKGLVRSRGGIPHVYHPIVGRWVPTISRFDMVPDLSNWLLKNATNSSKDRMDYYNAWKEMPRGARIKNPYSYYPLATQADNDRIISAGAGQAQQTSVRIGNFNGTMNEADLVLMLSVYGPIIDVYRPTHKRRDVYMSKDIIEKCKKAFYVFVEFADPDAARALIADINGVQLYFMNYPITVDIANRRSGTPKF